MKRFKKWIISIVSLIFMLLIVTAALVVWVDPFFQYHAPLADFPIWWTISLPRIRGWQSTWTTTA